MAWWLVLQDLNQIDIDPTLAFVAVETYASRFQCKERMVAPYANILAGDVLGATLADDDGSCFYKLLVATLEPQSFSVAVAPVLG